MPPWILLMLPQLIAGMGQLIAGQSNVNRMNKYNSPVEQIKRLRAAGLPYAAYQAGQAGNQSQLPGLEGFNTIGNAIGTGLNQGNQMQMFKELLRKAQFDSGIAENLFGISEEEFKAMMEFFAKGPDGKQINMAQYNKLLDVQMKEYGVMIQKNQARISKINRLIMDAKFKDGSLMNLAEAEFNKIVLGNDLMRQNFQSNASRSAAFNRIVEHMERGGLSFMEALLIQVLGGLTGGVKMGGMNLGF